jgi:predicted Zn finger-like uncharacterized protein
MIVSCPQCQTRFALQAAAFGGRPRQLKCGRCQHGWRQDPPQEKSIESKLLAKMEGRSAAGAAALSALSTLLPMPGAGQPCDDLPYMPPFYVPLWRRLSFWIQVMIGVVALAAMLIFGRQTIAKLVPETRPLYAALGLHIHVSGEGLKFQDVKSELRYDSGIMRLFIDGAIFNETQKSLIIPDVIAKAVGPDRTVAQSWILAIPMSTLGPGETVAFHGAINASSKQMIESVNLQFVEPDEKKDDVKLSSGRGGTSVQTKKSDGP